MFLTKKETFYTILYQNVILYILVILIIMLGMPLKLANLLPKIVIKKSWLFIKSQQFSTEIHFFNDIMLI